MPKPTIATHLGLWDTVSIIAGIVVGTAIFRSPPLVFQNVSDAGGALVIWLLGGVLCVCGALCYAELATTYPRNGGDYHYLSIAYGKWLGFLFGWGQLVAILTGSIGAMGYAFADYAAALWHLSPGAVSGVAVAVIVALTIANVLGAAIGTRLQNVFTSAKILGLALVVLAGLFWWPDNTPVVAEAPRQAAPQLGLALVFVLYAFGGWNDAVFVAAEVRDQHRNMPRALLLGIGGITLLYIAVNFAYLRVLGIDAARETASPAAAVLERAIGPWAAAAVSVLVMISAVGAINGMILAGSRIYATMGEDFRLFSWLGRWNQRAGVPTVAVVVQGAVATLLVCAVGTQAGRDLIDDALRSIALPALPWDEYFGGFETLVAATAPVFWLFFLLTGLAVFILRAREPKRRRPFSIPCFPLPPIVFCLTCLYMLYCSLDYAGYLSLLGLAPLAAGIPLYLWSRRVNVAFASNEE